MGIRSSHLIYCNFLKYYKSIIKSCFPSYSDHLRRHRELGLIRYLPKVRKNYRIIELVQLVPRDNLPYRFKFHKKFIYSNTIYIFRTFIFIFNMQCSVSKMSLLLRGQVLQYHFSSSLSIFLITLLAVV